MPMGAGGERDVLDPTGRTPVWLDADPGHDDALAIILAAHNPKLLLLGISTVAGNQSVDKVTRNALDVLAVAGVTGVDVIKGQAKPLMRPAPILCPEIHGESGLDGPDGGPVLPHCGGQPAPGRAPVVMGERIAAFLRQHPAAGPVRLVCTGSLTNAALMLALYPELSGSLEIIIMGGALGIGNTGPVQEFNIQTDPEAAKVVFEAGIPLTMVPIEVTHTALVTRRVISRLLHPTSGAATAGSAGAPTRFRALMERLLLFFAGTYREVFAFEDPPLHDPCAVAYVIDPGLFKADVMRVDVETASSLCAGQTVCDVWHQSGRPKNCRVCRSMDVDGFWELMHAALDAADAASPLNT